MQSAWQIRAATEAFASIDGLRTFVQYKSNAIYMNDQTTKARRAMRDSLFLTVQLCRQNAKRTDDRMTDDKVLIVPEILVTLKIT